MNEAKYRTEWLQRLRSMENKPSFVSTLDNIEKFGWEALLISADHQKNSFAYTAGLYDTMKFPELIVVGLKKEVAHHALRNAVEAMQAGAHTSRQAATRTSSEMLR